MKTHRRVRSQLEPIIPSPSSYRINSNKVLSRETKRELHELGGEGWKMKFRLGTIE
jgi:hypothetical protein